MKIVLAVTTPEIGERMMEWMPEPKRAEVCYTDKELITRTAQQGDELTHIFVMEDLFKDEYPWDWMPRLRRSCPQANIVLSQHHQEDPLFREVKISLGLEFNIGMIPPYGIFQDVIHELSTRFFNSRKITNSTGGNLISFLSAAPKDGSTSVAISTALALAKNTGKSIALLDLNFKSPEIQDQLRLKGAKGFPYIQAECDSGTLSPDTLLRACLPMPGTPNLHILTGLRRREWAERILSEEIGHLLEVARETFDIVIADVHSFPDQAATVECVRNADIRFVVVQPLVTSYESAWHDWYRGVWSYFGLGERDFRMILNRSVSGGHNAQDVRKSTGFEPVAVLPDLGSPEGAKAVNEGIPLYCSEGRSAEEFKGEIGTLSRWIADQAGIQWIEQPSTSQTRARHKSIAMILPFMKNFK
ncbi:hypothetical protein SY83_12970 [Paenibacillus swuensis]|uniref:CobQ/CobB/MinD/ParA nucleotide binding domain-containing protein n=1 Tax=Paenibacillus swuensis TaxID=1178515 RepID=A0A172TIY5_9BACL|nr:hypothetical protein [Paenibacillus swuensis]ANE47029.1 hypothetical protein SY83_12970 [Paenibacillus swuensis]